MKQLMFVAKLVFQKDGSFTPDTGSNKGQVYKWTDLEFNDGEYKFDLRTKAPVKIDEKMMFKDVAWVMDVEIKQGGKVKVLNISGKPA